MKSFFTFLILIILIAVSCNNASNEKKNGVTDKIRYVVSIKNSDKDADWWIDNIEGQKRESFVGTILNVVLAGKVKAYEDEDFKIEFPAAKIKAKYNRIDSLYIPSLRNPKMDSLILIKEELDAKAINKIAFVEQWNMDPATLKIEKNVLGFCPVVEVFTSDPETGEQIFKGLKALFWVKLSKGK